MPPAARGRPKGEKPWSEALRKAAYRAAGEGNQRLIDRIAETTVKLAMAGDVQAIKEIGDRLDGKAHQTSESYVETETRFVIESPAVATDVDTWQSQHGNQRLIQ